MVVVSKQTAFYEDIAAVAEILIAKRCPKTGKLGGITYNRLLLVPAEPPWYVIRMPGGVGGLLSDGESYPNSPNYDDQVNDGLRFD